MKYQMIIFGVLIALLALLLTRVYVSFYPRKNLRVARIGVLTSLAVILGVIETAVPDFIVPGVKVGFPNVLILLLICYGDKKEALIISLLRVFIVGLLRGNLFQMGGLMSLAGALASFFVMVIIRLVYRKSSPIIVSVFGALTHGLAQLLVGVSFLGTWSIFYYYPLMGLLSIAAGVLSGLVTLVIGKRLQRILRK